MTNTNCKNCDRDNCPMLDLPATCTPEEYPRVQGQLDAAKANCVAHRVNWRARALTEAARADAAEARIADTSRDARLIGLQANKAQAIARDPFWAGAQKAVQNLLARLEPKP